MDASEAYEIRAHEYLQGRDPSLIGAKVVDQWARTLDRGTSVIELACGGGYPVTRALNATGLELWAIDSSPTLLTKFQSRFPHIPVQCAKVQESDFFNLKYHGVIAIGLLFLLPESDQAALISRIAEILQPKGRFLFMAPIQTGIWNDLNTGLECISLGRERYSQLLMDAGFRIVATYTDKGDNNYYDAEKIQ